MSRLVAACTAILALLGSCAEIREAPPEKPNILFAIADDASFPHMSAYGTEWVNTPNFDRVARDGVLFWNA